MVVYIASNCPEGFIDGVLTPNQARPAQIYEWYKHADPAYCERAWDKIRTALGRAGGFHE